MMIFSTIKATCRPVSQSMWTDPRTGEQIQVNDFGDCNGIKKVKGFKSILADQAREVKAGRKLVELSILELKRPATVAVMAWRQKHGRNTWGVRDQFEAFLEGAWEAAGCPGQLHHFIRAAHRVA